MFAKFLPIPLFLATMIHVQLLQRTIRTHRWTLRICADRFENKVSLRGLYACTYARQRGWSAPADHGIEKTNDFLFTMNSTLGDIARRVHCYRSSVVKNASGIEDPVSEKSQKRSRVQLANTPPFKPSNMSSWYNVGKSSTRCLETPLLQKYAQGACRFEGESIGSGGHRIYGGALLYMLMICGVDAPKTIS